jgi:hypothetical protein
MKELESEEVGFRFTDFFNFLRRKDIAQDKFKEEKQNGLGKSFKKRNASRKAQQGGYYQVTGRKD